MDRVMKVCPGQIPTDGNRPWTAAWANAVKREDQTEAQDRGRRPSRIPLSILAQQTKAAATAPADHTARPNVGLMNPNSMVPFHTPGIDFPTPQPVSTSSQGAGEDRERAPTRSLHDRRSSLPNAAGLVSNNPMMPPRAAVRRQQRSGLSVDLSQMNLGFLSGKRRGGVPAEIPTFQQQQQAQPQQQSVPFQAGDVSKATNTKMTAAEADEANRKLYKCGRCGQPKVGHVCTMPDQRNNWTQVDLEVTKGIKVIAPSNCHILPVKTPLGHRPKITS
ncbi:hypothetical protein FI667_g17704, partial [Globisporangium splendens]